MNQIWNIKLYLTSYLKESKLLLLFIYNQLLLFNYSIVFTCTTYRENNQFIISQNPPAGKYLTFAPTNIIYECYIYIYTGNLILFCYIYSTGVSLFNSTIEEPATGQTSSVVNKPLS